MYNLGDWYFHILQSFKLSLGSVLIWMLVWKLVWFPWHRCTFRGAAVRVRVCRAGIPDFVFQRDATEKSECKTLISLDPDEGSLLSQQESFRFASAALRVRRRRLCDSYTCAGDLFAVVSTNANEAEEVRLLSAIVADTHALSRLHLQHICLWFSGERPWDPDALSERDFGEWVFSERSQQL